MHDLAVINNVTIKLIKCSIKTTPAHLHIFAKLHYSIHCSWSTCLGKYVDYFAYLLENM